MKVVAVLRCALALVVVAYAGVAMAAPTALFVIGDTGDCSSGGAAAVSAAIRAQPDWQQGWLIEVGDLAYPKATRENLARCHEPHFGMFARRLAVPGNHDWSNSSAQGFRSLFPDPLPRVAALDGRWQVWLLDSELRGAAWRAQIHWLDTQLSQVAGACVIAAWHRPRWSSGWHGNEVAVAPLWQRLAGVATITLHGHDHHYESVAPLNQSGEPDERGTRSFVSGNGGASLYPTIRKSPYSKAIAGHWGFLRIDLDGERYSWTAFDVAGATLDTGSGQCLTNSGSPH